ncbi:DUF1240 domain-containing protein [Serratia fonticola]|uniref:DUF1240 domain-containing protein n=1 Tax=Serratia fonticola TaxID=47917 RepID=UPI000742DF1E|nr:DUF1240 domain-containing protein [Serratia fonticola]ALX92838.1 hypothetical protein AV650_04370 [Serratia fonticola]MBP1038494.1 DUF1240 domain-containing protein [Serratia fonticola]NYA44920.1 DUF1240 domain-containing protein [Serratia fonticola]
MKNKIELETTFIEKLSFLFSFFVGLFGVLFVPYILKNKVLPYLSYPDVVSFYLMANYMVAGFFGFVMMMVMSGYVLVTRRKNLTKIKKFSMLCIYLTALFFVLVTVFNFYFTSALHQKGYGTCWKKSLYSETLYIKDASECKKRGTQVLKRPRAVYRR